jgi:hypothetical protein
VAVFATSASSTHEKMDDAAVRYLVVGNIVHVENIDYVNNDLGQLN